MNQFYTRAEAAGAIAAQLHPDDAKLREQAAENYSWRLYDALCDGELTGRDPTNRLPITLRGLAGAIAFGGCLIGELDLNGWLVAIGVGVRLSSPESISGDTRSKDAATESSDMGPGAAREDAILATFEKFKSSGTRDFRQKTIDYWKLSKSTIYKSLGRARKRRGKPASWNPFDLK
jgi:hypothetical protein